MCSFVTRHNQAWWLLHLRDGLRPATQTADETVSFPSETVSEELILCARRPHQGLDLTAVCHRNRLQRAYAHLRWPLACCRSVLFMAESRFQLYRADGRQCMTSWRVVCWCQRCEQSAPWWEWGYGMVRDKLRTKITIAFYRWQFECTEIPWRDPEAHYRAIHLPPSPHVSAW